jgi:hypothetical protein
MMTLVMVMVVMVMVMMVMRDRPQRGKVRIHGRDPSGQQGRVRGAGEKREGRRRGE